MLTVSINVFQMQYKNRTLAQAVRVHVNELLMHSYFRLQ